MVRSIKKRFGDTEHDSVTTEQVSITKQNWVSINVSHTEWADGLSNEEICRIPIDTGEKFVLNRLGLMMKGGGTESDLTLEVYNSTDASSIDSTTGGSVSKTGGESSSGDVVIIRLTNSSGSSQTASIFIDGKIVEV